MIIKNISMKNFQCYFGEHENNRLNFREGLNLILGDNGGGKSKLFDAFYWLIYDQIFNSDTRKFIPTNRYKQALISDKAKYECSVGETINAEVILEAENSTFKKYKLSRIYQAKKISDREWACTPSRLLIDEYKGASWHSIESNKHQHILNMIIPEHLKPYMWFQGEQVDGLMDFTDKSTLTNAINLLSNITVYDDLITISEKVSDKATKNYRIAQNKLTRDEQKSKDLNDELDSVRATILNLETSIETNQENFLTAKDMIEGLIGQIDDATEKTELKKEKENIEQELENINKVLTDKYNGLNKKIFTDSWVLKQSTKSLDKFSTKYKKYFKEHVQQEQVSSEKKVVELPIDIPQPIHVDNMLEQERCFVCNRDAKKGSDEYAYIQSLLGRTEDEKKENIFAHDCSNYFQKLYDNALGFKQIIKTTDKRVASELDEIQTLKNSFKEKSKKVQEIKGRFEELIGDDKSENIVSAFRTHESNKETYQSLLDADKNKLEQELTKEKSIEESLQNLVEGNVDEKIEKANRIFKQLSTITKTTRDDVFHNLILEIEEKANLIFKKMAESNNSITGIIKFKKQSSAKYIPEIIGSDGYILSSPNDSNIILVKLSLIMAIILSRGKSSENYALILDAPTTKMADKYTQGFYKTLGDNFKQSIVMSYDFLDIDYKTLVTNFNIGSIHTVESNIPNNDDSDRNALEMKITAKIL